jgi:putative membrane protein
MHATVKTALAAFSLVFALVAPAQAGGLSDAAILSIFDQANMADITTARLGYKKGQAPEVRALALMVMTDHVAVQQMGRDLAAKLGIVAVPPDDDMAPAALAESYGTLQGLSGTAFDAAYLRYEIAFHASVIDAIETVLLPAIQASELKDLITQVLPGFQHHLTETRRVAEALGVK